MRVKKSNIFTYRLPLLNIFIWLCRCAKWLAHIYCDFFFFLSVVREIKVIFKKRRKKKLKQHKKQWIWIWILFFFRSFFSWKYKCLIGVHIYHIMRLLFYINNPCDINLIKPSTNKSNQFFFSLYKRYSFHIKYPTCM